MSIADTFNALPAFNAFKITSGNLEKITQSIYDTVLYPTAGVTQLPFFSTQYGQGLSSQNGCANQTKNFADTNLQASGTLPQGQGYIVESIEVDFQPGSSAVANTFALLSPIAFNATAAATVTAGLDDINAVLNGGWLEFSIMQKNYLREGPLLRFPPKAVMQIDAAVSSNSATTAESLAAKGRAAGKNYYLDVPLPIKPLENFSLTLNWAVAIATPSGKNGRVQCILDGQLYRPQQ